MKNNLESISLELSKIYQDEFKSDLFFTQEFGFKKNKVLIYNLIGKRLIDLCIKKKYGKVSEICGDFRKLGRAISYLSDIYEDLDINNTVYELSWLGIISSGGDFIPSLKLRSNFQLRDCSKHGWNYLFQFYLDGKETYFRE